MHRIHPCGLWRRGLGRFAALLLLPSARNYREDLQRSMAATLGILMKRISNSVHPQNGLIFRRMAPLPPTTAAMPMDRWGSLTQAK